MRIANTLPRTAAMLFLAGLLSACATQPTDEMAMARDAIETARESGAAAPEMGHAQRKMALANRWIAAKDYGPARWLAEQAQVDAELALAQAAGNDVRRALAQRAQARAAYVQTSQLAQGPQ